MKKKVQNSKFNKILSDIKSIKIQGAENVAKAGIKAFLLNPTKPAAKQILSTRPTEPLLQNAIRSIQKFTTVSKDFKDYKHKIQEQAAKKFLKNIEISHNKAIEYGASLIKNDMNIYTHCHSSTVIDILKLAKSQKKKFVVYTTEVEPLLQGRQTAKDLAKAKIKIIIAPDLAAEHSLSKCDLFLFGADAFTKTQVANKIGTSTLVRLAKIHKVPAYACGISLKYTKKITIKKRSGKEVWDERIKEIEVLNPPFDKTKLKDLTGIISEFGILKQKEFVKKARKKLINL
jgi:translation initiation factor 2B subunit (eIF-2B alpha/beta/delta family)